MARTIRFHRHGGPEVLTIEDVDIPSPGPGEVSIRTRALGLNRAEALFRAGTYIEQAQFPSGIGLEVAGMIESLGAGVEGLSPGDAVSLVPPRSMVSSPVHGELVTVPAELAVKHPPTLSWEAAAASWMQYLTAYGALIDIARLTQGEHVVITAASSSVGLAAIQISNRIGAIPIAVTRTTRKAEALHEAGAAHVVASAEENLEARLKQIAGEHGIRVVLDAVGGPAFLPLTAAMARGGVLIEYGGLSPEATPFPLFNVLSKSLTLRGYLVHEIAGAPARLAAAKAFILEGLGDGSLKPIIARTFPFEQIVEAHRYLESNEQFGKVVVTL
ncbi:zinc-dependent alcohol dehydrogenase family protein [Bosea sp. (in: a-proteobacteria)]|uniref:zinc-dependent alcohol dehydrogenase family protein n=1 Tax=Bosea sp. (in: a-proteobacteria) TaxID=1871050 RepID=UPI002DDC97B3|nr:zinc-dependent alcohol dehydrogenase family protein [Bosea sp. (in: a-proteobacteria)]HEV2512903.1 zinc-dependent alcohol dehydrogenase family protein [Bosea sp. (in: a-proteobacteria)]